MDLFRTVYRVKDGVVFWNDRPVPQVDASSFVPLGGMWARDARSVFVQGSPKKGIEVATFEYLNPVYVKDAHAVFDWEGRIKGANPSTFSVLDAGVYVEESMIATQVWARGYARDSQAVYYHDQMVGRASALRGADPLSFVSLRNDYGYDSRGVWLQKDRLPKAEPKTWVYLGRLWSMDRERTYYANREMTGIDRAKFTVFNAPAVGNLATDGYHCFDADRPIDTTEFSRRVQENSSKFDRRFDNFLRKIVVGEPA